MTLLGWLQIGLLFGAVLLVVKPLGIYMAHVFEGQRNFLSPVLGPVERLFYATSGIDPKKEQNWLGYTLAMLAFSVAGGDRIADVTGAGSRPDLGCQGFFRSWGAGLDDRGVVVPCQVEISTSIESP